MITITNIVRDCGVVVESTMRQTIIQVIAKLASNLALWGGRDAAGWKSP
jgi:hypothetical protein